MLDFYCFYNLYNMNYKNNGIKLYLPYLNKLILNLIILGLGEEWKY